MYDVITFGEPLIRFEPSNPYGRLERTDFIKMALGGAEVNVSAILSNICKINTAIITRLPQNPLGRWVENYLSSFNVSTKFITHGGDKVGLYYSEQGSRPRAASVTYDRRHSSFLDISISDYNFDSVKQAKIFHTTGITLALNQNTRDTALEMIKIFRKSGTLISFDVNYRANLWDEETAKCTIEKFLPYVDILFISEETCKKMFKRTGSLEKILEDFANDYDIKIIASTKRNVINQSNHQFSSILYNSSNHLFYKTKEPYDIEVVDRVGSGDAFIAGVLYGILKHSFDLDIAQAYGDAFAALKCTVPGDILISNQEEIEAIIKKHINGITEDINR
jgi:2-dehydro-3-deoxygluconokinase